MISHRGRAGPPTMSLSIDVAKWHSGFAELYDMPLASCIILGSDPALARLHRVEARRVQLCQRNAACDCMHDLLRKQR
eukprot:6213330-Pleurochrysis_carterae.AAC.3